jgi:competence protein CoiA
MLSAIRKSDGISVLAHTASRMEAPFLCPQCGDLVVLRRSEIRLTHFAHTRSGLCAYSAGESDEHRRCKLEIYQALRKHPNARDVFLEKSLTTARPDVSATINGVPVAIEVQISNLPMETIIRRTREYTRKGIYVLWLLQWTPYLDASRYTPRLWEKWIHAAYFGRVYYWLKGLTVVRYRFDAHLKHVPVSTWFSRIGKKMKVGGYTTKSRRFCSPVRGPKLHIATDFGPQDRECWRLNGLIVPAARLFMEQSAEASKNRERNSPPQFSSPG